MDLIHSFIGLFQKKNEKKVEDMEFSGVLKKLQEAFPGIKYKQTRIFGGDQESGISRGFGFRP